MPDDKKPLPTFGQKGVAPTYNNTLSAEPILPDGPTQYKKGYTAETDPFYSGGSFDPNQRTKVIEGGLDRAQSNWDKLGNGVAKMGGSLAQSVLSVPGTIYGLAAAPFEGADALWNNEFNKIGAQVSDYMQKNFRNYRSISEQDANPWSPSYWATMNFLSDGIISNLGYALGAYGTSALISKGLSMLAPVIARGALAEGLQIVQQGGVDALEAFTKAKNAVAVYDKVQAGLSTAFAAAAEGSTEAISTYNELKQKLINQAGGESNISADEMAKIEAIAKQAGNTVYGLNFPILMASNTFQFAKGLLNYKSLAQKGANAIALTMGEEFGNYAGKEAAKGIGNGILRGLKTVGKAAANNLSEAAEEGAQYIVSEGAKNYYSRKFNKEAEDDTFSYLDAMKAAAHDLFTTQEGVANLIGGFATPGFMPHGMRDTFNAITGKENTKLRDYQLSLLNGLSVKDSIKDSVESAVRAASINHDLENAIRNGDDYEARNLKNDAMKNYIESRIKAGRYDLLEGELDKMMKMSKDQFKETFDIDTEADFDHQKLLQDYKGKARDMQKTWLTLDRLFQPSLYRFNDSDPATQQKAKEQMGVYHELAWSYLMDAKDADKRVTELRTDVDQLLGGTVSLQNILGNKSTDQKLNEWIKEYNTAAIEYKINKELDPQYEDKVEADYQKRVMKRIQAKVRKHVAANKESLGLPDYIAKGDPEFLDEYLFDVEKQLQNVNGERVFERALFGGKEAIVDSRSVARKINDLRKLEARRMLALQSYNNYRTMVTEGTYMDARVKNPNYDPSNPDAAPEYILNEQLLRGDNYQKFQDEKDTYRKEQEKDAADNTKKAQAFMDYLKQISKRGSLHPKAQAYRDAFNTQLHGNATQKGFNSMTGEEFEAAAKEAEKENLRHKYAQTFRVNSQEARDKFPMDEYVQHAAKLAAINASAKKRRGMWESAMKKEGKRMAKHYVKLFEATGEEVAEGFYEEQLQKYAQDGNVNQEGVAIIQAIVDKTREELGVAVSKPAPELEEEQPATSDDAALEGEVKESEPEKPVADVSEKPVVADGSKEFPGGAEPDNIKGATNSTDEQVVEDQLTKDATNVASTYLTLRRSDLEYQDVEDAKPIRTLDSLHSGDRVIINGKQGVLRITADRFALLDETGKETYAGVPVLLEAIAKAGGLHKVYTYRENVFNEDGTPKVKQFNGDLYDPKSDISLIPGRKLRLERTSDASKPVQWVKVWVKKGNTDEWVDSGIAYSLDSKQVRSRFPASSKVSDETIERIESQVDQLAAEVKKHRFVFATIGAAKEENSNSFGFGKLIFQPGQRGSRESKGIGHAIGLDFLNDTSKTGGVLLGVITSDLSTGASVASMNDKGALSQLNNKAKVYIPQSAIDALTSNGNKAGQAVAALPTGQVHEGKQVYLPVLLHTKQLSDDTSHTMKRVDDQQMSLGEAIVDVLLNPGKTEYASSFAALYEYAMGVPFDPAKPNYEGFYTNENLLKITSSVFYSNLNTGMREETVRYKFPFGFFVEKKGDNGIAVTLDITKTAKGMGRTAKKALVFITKGDGSLNTQSVEERMAAYLKNAPSEVNGKKVNIDRNFSYKEVQDQLRKKPYRVDMRLASKSVKESQPYSAIVFGENGMPAVKRYDSYLHYIDDQNILTTTISAVKDKGRQFYFANRTIPYVVNYGEKADEAPPTVTVVNKAKQAQVQQGMVTDKRADIERRRKEELDSIEVLPANGEDTHYDTVVSNNGSKEGWSTQHAVGSTKYRPDPIRNPSHWVPGYKTVNAFIEGVVKPEINAKYDAELKALGEEKKATTPKQEAPAGGLNLTAMRTFKTNAKGEMTFNKDAAKDEATPLTNDLMDWMNNDSKGLIDFTRIQTVDQFSIRGLESQVPAMTEQITQELTDMLLEEYSKPGGTRSYNKRRLKLMLKDRLAKQAEELQSQMKKTDDKQMAGLLLDRYNALVVAQQFFDEADFDKTLPDKMKERLSYGEDPATGKRTYFVGFYNLALNELFKSKIVQVSAYGKQYLDFESREDLGYTTRYDDNWSFKIDPRNTLSKFARILMSRVPQQSYNGTTELSDDYGPLGLTRYMPYESVQKALLSYAKGLAPHEIFSFVESIPTNPETAANPALMGIHKLLTKVRNDNEELYTQAVRHLFNASILQQANYLILNVATTEGKEAEHKIFDASRQMINDEILSRWSKGLTTIIRQGKYVDAERSIDKETGAPKVLYVRKPIGEFKLSIQDYIGDKLDEAFKDTTNERYEKMADVYVNDLGFPLSGDGSVKGTAAVLKAWSEKRKVNDVLVPVFQKHFRNIREYNSLEDMVRDTLVNLVATKLDQTLSHEGEPSSFNPEEPLSNSTKVMNAYAKALKGQFQDVVNATINDINNNNRYIYVTRNNIAENMLFARDVNYMRQVAQSTYGKYMPGIKDLFDADGELNQEKWNEWTQLEMDYTGGVVRDNYRKSEASSAKAADWNVLSLLMYQNDERYNTGKARNGVGRYVMSFGDATTAPYYTAPKEDLLLHFKEVDGKMRVVVNDIHKESGTRLSTVREQLYNIFKTEVNRSVEAFTKFDRLQKAGRFSDIPKQLRSGYHYVKVGDNYYMGAAAGIFGFNENVYNQMLGENSPLFEVAQTAGGPRVTGLDARVLNENGDLNEEYLVSVFKGFASDFINDLVDAKMEQLKPFLKDLLVIDKAVSEDGKHVYEGFNMPLFSKRYKESFEQLMKENGFMVERGGQTHPMVNLYQDETLRTDDQLKFDSEQEIDEMSYPALLFKAMVADQQLNHFLFQSKWSAFNGADPALFTKDGSTNYKSWYDNYNKRLKEFVTPKIQSVTTKEDQVKLLTFNDPVLKQFKRTITHEQYGALNKAQREMVDYLITNKIGKGEYVAVNDKVGKTITLPSRVIGGQIETMFNLMRSMWNDKEGATPVTKAKFNKALGEYFNAKTTDGNTYVTLREYLYRAYLDGRIADESEFNKLMALYGNKDTKLSLTNEQFKNTLPLLGLKYVKSGVKFEGGEMLRIYGKDGEFVLFPSLTADTHWDDIREHMETLEDKGLNGGVILSPVSAMKLGAHNAVDLFDSTGKYTQALAAPVVDSWSRDVAGKQIQNPDKFTNETTAASQANTNIHNNIPDNVLFGTDMFTQTFQARNFEEDAANAAFTGLNIAGMRELRKQAETFTRHGLRNGEIMGIKHAITSELMKRDLETLMQDWGLKYEQGSKDYQAALKELGMKSATVKELLDAMKDEDPKRAQAAYQAYKTRNQVVLQNIDEFLNDVKAQLLQRKGLTPNNTYLLRRIDAFTNKMEIPITFNPNNVQVQSVILSRLNSIVQGRKLPGFSYIQMASVGFSKKNVKGDSDLKSYSPIYNDKDEFVGINPAEIAIPWRFMDEQGHLLDYDTYVKEDGTPRMEKWDKRMLDLIGLRIPNTGPNTMGFFRVKRFLRGYKDVAQVPMEIVAQMNSDFDFDKLVTYQYHYTLNDSGKLTKVQGYMHDSQHNIDSLLNSADAKQRALEYTLRQSNPKYEAQASLFNQKLDAKVRELQSEILSEVNEGLSEDEVAAEIEDVLKLSRNSKLNYISPYIDYEAMTAFIKEHEDLQKVEAEAAKSFDMKAFMELPDALQIMQSSAQLENALIDTYHLMLRHPEVAKQMLSPLTTDYMKDQVDGAHYDGQSLRDVKQTGQFMSPNAEVSKAAVRSSSAGADNMIGILANFQKMQHLAQIADLALEDGDAIYFGDKQGNVIKESEWNKDEFAVSKKTYAATEATEHMKATINGKEVIVPYRLGRLYTKRENGETISIAEAGAASLQAALDNLNDPLLGVAAITEEVANEFQLMLLLGYVDHAVPFMNQPIVQQYADIVRGTRNITGTGTYEEQMLDLLRTYAERAGMADQLAQVEQVLGGEEGGVKVRDLVKGLMGEVPVFSASDLRYMLTVPEADKDTEYYYNQMAVLELMLRMKERGQRNFELQQAVNVDSKGLKDTTIIGVDDQLTKYNQVVKSPLINAGKVTKWNFTHTAAKRYGLDTVRDLFEFGSNLDMFQDLKPAFSVLREKTAALHKRNDSLDAKKQINVGIIQWMFSDPQLFSDIVKDIMGTDSVSADDVRKSLMKEDYAITEDEKGDQYYDNQNNAAVTVAGLLDKVAQTIDPKTKKPYEERYPIIANLRAIQQQDNESPSVVVYLNANNYKQQLDILLPQSIMQMLRDQNEDVQKLAKMLIVYGYMVGGTNNPISYVTHIPQEVLFQYGFGQKLRSKMDALNTAFQQMDSEFQENHKPYAKSDKRPYIVKYLSGAYIRRNSPTLNMLRGFIAQYYQHRPFDYSDSYSVNAEQVKGDDPASLRIAKKDFPTTVPVVVVKGKRKRDNMVLFSNGDGTYAQVDTLGYKYNVTEYSFNRQGNPGTTIVGQSLNAYNLAAPKQLKVAQTEDAKLQPIPFHTGKTINTEFKSTASEMLEWARQDAIATKARTGQSSLDETVALADYLMPLLPTGVTFGINEAMDVKGKASSDATTGYPVKVEYNPKLRESTLDERSDFRMTMLHESLHVAGGRAVSVIESVQKGTIDEKAGAKALKVPIKQFREMMAAHGELSKMISDKQFKQLFQQELQYQLSYSGMPNAAGAAKRVSDYTFNDVEEFMAFTFSDERFRKALNNLNYGKPEEGKRNKTFWTRFVELFRKVLGIKEGSALEHALYNSMAVLEPLHGKTLKTVVGVPTKTQSKALIDIEQNEPWRVKTMFTEETRDTIPFAVDLQEVSDRYNFKQVNC
jgi:hypothetical protein